MLLNDFVQSFCQRLSSFARRAKPRTHRGAAPRKRAHRNLGQIVEDLEVRSLLTTLTYTLDLPTAPETNQTDWTSSGNVPQFDPTLGQLNSISIYEDLSVTGEISIQNRSTSNAPTNNPRTIVINSYDVGLSLTAPSVSIGSGVSMGPQTAILYKNDGTINYTNVDPLRPDTAHFGPFNPTDSDSQVLTNPLDFVSYVGFGSVLFTGKATATTTFSASVNFDALVKTTANTHVRVVYDYTPNSISGYVYHDSNNDGSRAGEDPIPGTTVTLTGTDDLGNNVNTSTTTDSNGFYEFLNLRTGVYTLTETQPAGFLDGKDTVGTPGGTTTNDKFSNIVITPGTHGVENNFGELKPSSISGYVYYDSNNDGSRSGEAAIPNTLVSLSGTDFEGNSISDSVFTDLNGYYLFSNLRPGNYTVTETQPAGYLDGKDTIGTPGGTTANDVFSNIALGENVNGVENNFGELKAASLSGYVYYDSNNDGSRAGEAAIPGTTVSLTGTDDLGAAVSASTTTDVNGFYSFTGLRPGTYALTETQPAGYLDGKDTIGTPGGTSANDAFSAIVLNAGVDGVENNYGELKAASLSGYVYYDSNNDGSRAGEAAIPGTTVSLTGTDDLGAAVSASTTTDVNGFYSFTGLRPGTYALTETQPAGYLDGKDTIGTPGGTSANDAFSAIVLNAGVDGVENNYGELKAANLSGYVYYDSNNDGSRAGEAAIPGTTVTLTGTDDLGAAVSASTTTDVNGFYSFTGLRPGTYALTETQPAGYLDGKDTIGTPGGTSANDAFSAIVLNAGVNGVENNYGELKAASLSGYVYYDSNNDGLRAGEAAIPGTTVTLTGTDDLGAAVSASTTTDVNGFYTFTGLRPGTYALTETQPAGYLDGKDTIGTPGGTTANDAFSAIVLNAGVDGVENNYGELKASSLAGYVYYDSNNDGSRAGEAPIPLTVINLNGVDDLGVVVFASTSTDASGFYKFDNLRPGTYSLSEVQPGGYLDGKDTIGTPGGTSGNDNFSSIALGAGFDGVENNYGELKAASLSGYVYYDSNNDGSRAGEAAIPGTTVTLTGTDDLGAAVSASTTTDVNGFYSFTGLRPGTYKLVETQPAGYLDGKDTIGTPGGTTANDAFSAIVLNAGVNGVENNYGELKAASLSGYVYYDSNNDGSRAGEAAIPGTTVTLTGTDDLGAAVSASTTTDVNGFYSFTGLRPGTYKLVETQPAGYLDGKDTIGTPGGSTANDAFSAIVLNAGVNGVENNYGELKAACLSGYVYYDSNNDGLRAGEAPIPGTTVTLTGTDDLGAAVSASTTTDATGFYKFAGLRPGTYKLVETQPAGYLDGKDTIGTPGGTTANDAFSAIVLNAGVNGVENNYGELKASSLSGYVYYDSNNDGSRAGEAAIPGTTVTLTGTDDLGAAVSASTTTDVNGFYSFTGLRPGTYKLAETQPAGYLDGKDTIGTPGGTTANDVFSAIVLNAGVNGVENNYGELKAASLSGYVYYDSNNDGSRAGEAPIPGTTVTLTGTDDLGAAVSASTTTDATGFYKFAGLRPGTYKLVETQPASYLDGKDTIGTPGGTTANDVFSNIVLNAGVNGVENNYGELKAASLSGYVYYDANNDGIKQGTESPISGTTVKLTGTDDQGASVSVTTTTNAVGYYEFTNLRPGTYVITETQPAGYVDGKDTIGTPGGTTGNDVFSNIVLNAGINGVNNNFGEVKVSSLSGYVYVDANNDGIKQGSELPIANVTVKLTGTNDLGAAVSVTTTTNSVGFYSFTNLRPGTYTITETQPVAYQDGKDTIGTPGGTTGNDVFSAIALVAGFDGVNNNFGELTPPGSICGTKYLDVTGNGLTCDDTPLAGVTIKLYLDRDGNGVLTSADGAAVSSMVTGANGNYAFNNLAAGKYFVLEVVPAGYVRTAPTLDAYYTVDVQAGGQYANRDFANAEVGCSCDLGCVQYYINGCSTPVSDLRGKVNQGDVVEVRFSYTGNTPETYSLVSYTAPAASFSASNAYLQEIFDVDIKTVTRPGTYSLKVVVPNCYFQVDFVCGKPIDKFGPAGSNIFYSAQGRLISADNDGTQAEALSSLSGYVYVDANLSGTRQTTEVGIANVTLKLTGIDIYGNVVSLTTKTDSKGFYKFSGLNASDLAGYKITEVDPSGYGDGKESVGSLGGTVGNDFFIVVINTNMDGINYNFGETK